MEFYIESRLITVTYFFSFLIISNYVLINIVMASVIEVYSSIEEE